MKINWQKVLTYFAIVVSMLAMAGAAANTGITGPLFGIPYLLTFIYFVRKLPKLQIVVFTFISVTAVIMLGWDHSHNRLLYPGIGSRVDITSSSAWMVRNGQIHKKGNIVGQRRLETPLSLTLEEVKATHPETFTILYLVFKDKR